MEDHMWKRLLTALAIGAAIYPASGARAQLPPDVFAGEPDATLSPPGEYALDDGERLSPHGMRAGFITEAYLNGALDEQVMAYARQKDVNTTRRYRKRAKTVAASTTKLLDL
jgi:integrase